MEPMPKKKNYPKTVPAAVEYCLKTLNVGTLKEIARLEAMGAWHPDDASAPILEALVAYLRKHKDWKLRRRLLRAAKPDSAP